MRLADRYASLLPPQVRERALVEAPAPLSELELQARWFAGEFGREFRTTAGEPVRVVQFGVWNREAGPDFSHASISLGGGAPLEGPIEFDREARDWERHGHAQNPAYESVILHVYTRAPGAEFFTRTLRHRRVPQVLLDATLLRPEAPGALPEAKLGRCAGPLGAMPLERVRAVLLGAAEHRFRRKAALLARMSEGHGPDEALYQALAAVLGYKNNKLPFTLLSQRLPLKLLLKHRDEIDALLFGVSGFLPQQDLAEFDPATRQYVKSLWQQWWSRRAEFARLVLDPAVWKLSGQRPANHPQRRVAALAQVVRHWARLQRLLTRGEWERLAAFFTGLENEYWERHYTLSSKPSPRPMALVGESRIAELMLNVFLPLAASEDERQWERCRELPAAGTNRRVEVAATRLFGGDAERRGLLKSAAIQQGLLQVYEDFCLRDATDCAQCPFPRQLDQW